MEIAPPAPAVAEPVPKYKAPELPAPEVPLLNINLPLAPAVPALTDLMMTIPDDNVSPEPDDSVNEPPVVLPAPADNDASTPAA